MRIDDKRTVEQFRARLLLHAQQEFGEDRADELRDQIEHQARMMANVARQTLDLRDEPVPPASERGDA